MESIRTSSTGWGCLLLLRGGTILDISPMLMQIETRRGVRQSLAGLTITRASTSSPIWALIEKRTP
jgi:hypothetical protein